MSRVARSAHNFALALWLSTAAIACGTSTVDTGGESNWVRCSSDSDCDTGETCLQKRCQLELDASSAPPRNSSEPDVDAAPIASEPALETHCAFPSANRTSEPSGVVSGALPWSDSACTSGLSEPVALELPSPALRTLAFAYDVNGDGIDDPFYRDRAPEAQEQPFDLWVSEVNGSELRFVHELCALPPAAAEGRRFYVRDLDTDSVPDLVVEGRNGVTALRNTAPGFDQVLQYDFAPSEPGAWASLVDVVLADVAGDEALDLVVGFDRTPDGSAIELGVLLFEGDATTSAFAEPSGWRSSANLPAPESSERLYYGNFGLLELSDEPPQLWLQVGEAAGWVLEESLGNSPLQFDPELSSIHRMWSMPTPGSRRVIGVLGGDGLSSRFDLFLPLGDQLVWAGGLQPVFVPNENRELGGGAGLPRQFMLDVDGNTTLDFVEFDSTLPRLAIHPGDLILHFEEPDTLDLPRAASNYGHPFLAANGRALGLIAYDGELGLQPSGAPESPVVQRFICD